MYFDEDLLLDVRLNYLDPYVDYFVIVESSFTHSGEKRDLKFNLEKFRKFKDKIIYKVYDEIPNKIEEILDKDDETTKTNKYIWNAIFRENGQRNYLFKGIENANPEDLILISDVDEIPNLSSIDLKNINHKIILFKQEMFYYKFNLKLPNTTWTGTKACRKKNLINPQWLRNIKDRKYAFYRLDALFSEKKFINIKIIENGGWHFTNLKTAEEIKHKLRSYLHHREFDLQPLDIKEIENIINNRLAIYDLSADKRLNKIGKGAKLEKYEIDNLPDIIKLNRNKYKEWLD
tara:strand:+ start:183 stop:1052 length:870 start_codon:yes stop_codon:yes gene_type:complete